MDVDSAKIADLRKAIVTLEVGLEVLVAKVGRPEFITDKAIPRFRFKEPTPLHLQVVKGVRVVSGLNALLALLEKGFTQEMGVLLRTVDDFIAEMDFISEAVRTGKPTADQKRLLDLFFSDDAQSTEDLLADRPGTNRVVRAKIQASEARQLGGKDPHGTKKMVKAVDDVFSGYVHGAYPFIMELYEGGAWTFRLRGMLGTPLVATFRDQVAMYVHRSLNAVAGVLLQNGFTEACDALISERKRFEKASAYPDRE